MTHAHGSRLFLKVLKHHNIQLDSRCETVIVPETADEPVPFKVLQSDHPKRRLVVVPTPWSHSDSELGSDPCMQNSLKH